MVLKIMSNNNLHPHELAKNKCVWCEFTHRLCLESRLEELHLTCGSARSCGAGAGDGGGALLLVWASTTAQSGGVPRHGPLLRAPRPTVLLKQTNKQKKTSEKNKEDPPEKQKVADKENASKNEKNDVLHVRTQTSCSERTALPTLDLSLCNTVEPWGSEGGGRCLSNEAVALDMEVGIFVNGDRGGIGIEMVWGCEGQRVSSTAPK